MNTGQELRLAVLDDLTITLPAARMLPVGQIMTIENKGPAVLSVSGHSDDRITAPRMSPQDCVRYQSMLDSPADREMLGPYACELIQQALDYSRADLDEARDKIQATIASELGLTVDQLMGRGS